MKLLKWIGLAVLTLLIVVALYVFGALWSTGQFAKLYPHFDGTCTRLTGIAGAEDMELDAASGLVYFSSLDRRALARDPTVTGAIYRLPISDLDGTPTLAGTSVPMNFHPQGLSIYRDGTGRARLFVVNHPNPVISTVEVFDIAPDGRLTHLRTLKNNRMMVSANDIVAVGPNSFYLTNDSGTRNDVTKFFEQMLRLPTGSVIYYDGKSMAQAARGLSMANGIAVNPEGDLLFVAETTGSGIRAYQREISTGRLIPLGKISLKTYVDNLTFDEDGNLWAAAHPRILRLLAHLSDARKRSPSQVIRISFNQNHEARAKEIFLNDGVTLSGSSTALRHGQTLLISPIVEKHILNCRMARD